MTIGTLRVASLAATAPECFGDDDVGVTPQPLGHERRESVEVPLRVQAVDRDGLALHVAQVAQTREEPGPLRRRVDPVPGGPGNK